jgi:hypothetical protein
MYEAGQTQYAMEALTDSGDNTTFTSNATYFSDKSGYTPDIYPDGCITTPAIVPDDSAVNDRVDVPGCTCYLVGVKTTVVAAEVDVTRSADGGNPYRINSIVITNAGAYDKIAGTVGAAFSSTRGAAGGPPLITVGYIEVGQVKTTSTVAAAIADSEIYQVPGTSLERYDYPLWEVNYLPSSAGAADGGSITFLSALPDDHTGPVPKKVYAEYSDPIFAEMRPVTNCVPPGNTHSVSSVQVYGGTIGSRSSSLGQGSFESYLTDGINDPVVKLQDQVLTFKFFPDRYKDGFQLFQGKLGVSISYPPDGSKVASCTVSAETAAIPESA